MAPPIQPAQPLPQLVNALIQDPHDPELIRQAEVAYQTDRSRFLGEVVKHVPASYGGEVRHVPAAYEGVRHIPAAYGSVTAETADCHDTRPKQGVTWRDCIDREKARPKLYWRPRSVGDVVEIVHQARTRGARVKAVGAGHSFSDITDTSDYLVDTRCVTGVSPLDRGSLRDPGGAERIFRAAAGIAVRDLNARLLHAGLALQNAGGYTGQTIAGAISTGTHGSGITLGPLADQVVSFDMVAGDAKVYRLEPANGISDPTRFPRQEDGVEINLVQDDGAFSAAVVGVGCMGIITSLCLAAKQQYWLREVRRPYTWTEVRDQIQGGEINRYRHWEVAVNPYVRENRNLCLVTARQEVPEPGHLSPASRNRNLVTELLASVQGDGALLLYLMNCIPTLIPGFLDTCLKALVDPEYVDLSSRVFDLGPVNKIRAFGVEIGVPVENAIAATETVFAVAKEAAETGRYNTSPFSLRFVNESKATLTPMSGRHTCMIELIFLYQSTGSEELAKRYEVALRAHGGRPHWGLDLDTLQGQAAVKALYGPAFDQWLAVYRRFNVDGIFNNAFTERLGISV